MLENSLGKQNVDISRWKEENGNCGLATQLGFQVIYQKETEKEISEYIKCFFDKKYSPNWHCVVGKHFASYVTYTSKHYIFFYIG